MLERGSQPAGTRPSGRGKRSWELALQRPLAEAMAQWARMPGSQPPAPPGHKQRRVSFSVANRYAQCQSRKDGKGVPYHHRDMEKSKHDHSRKWLSSVSTRWAAAAAPLPIRTGRTCVCSLAGVYAGLRTKIEAAGRRLGLGDAEEPVDTRQKMALGWGTEWWACAHHHAVQLHRFRAVGQLIA